MAEATQLEVPTIQDNNSVPPADTVPGVVPPQSSNNDAGDQDVAMGGQEDAALKPSKPNDGPTLQQTLNSNYTNGASSPAAVATPARTSTPTPRAPSAVPADRTPAAATMPAEAAENGAPTRVYLNSKVTSHVLDGMKVLAKEKPADPLRVLGEFLLKRSAEYEAANGKEDKEIPGGE